MSTKPTLPVAKPVTFVSGQPPAGLIPAEAAILNAWLEQHYREYDEILLNVRVGHGIDPGDAVPDYVRANDVLNSQRRVDAFLRKSNARTIVEVKVRATLMAIGQLLGYRVLWLRDNLTADLPRLLLLCGRIDPDTIYCLNFYGIAYEVVPAGAPPSAFPQP